jgi:hypothetical protein
MQMLHTNERTDKSGDDRNTFLQRKRKLRDDQDWNKLLRKLRIIDIDAIQTTFNVIGHKFWNECLTAESQKLLS